MRTRSVLVSVALLASAVTVPTPGQGEGARLPANLRESQPVVCDGQNDIVISGRLIRTSGNGVEVRGNCDVEIVDSHILADGIGVLVEFNGDAEIVNSIIEGGVAALEARGNGDIEFEDSTLLGAIRALGNADIVDEGGNRIEGRVSVSGHGSVETDRDDRDVEAAEEEISVGGGEIRVGGITVSEEGVQVGGVTVNEQGVQVGGAGGVKVDQEGVEVGGAGGVAVRTTPGGDAVVNVGGEAVTVRSRADGSVVVVSPGAVVTDWRTPASARYGTGDTDSILVELGATHEGGETSLQLAGDVLFDFDSAAVRADAATTLAKVAHVLRQRSSGEIWIVGHTDSKGEDAYNQQLSERRALAVMQWLNANEGIPLSVMVGRGMGSKKPIAYNTMPDGGDNPEGRARNRRVEISFASAG